MAKFSSPKLSKIYPNWNFWFIGKPSGNPGDGLRGVDKKQSLSWQPLMKEKNERRNLSGEKVSYQMFPQFQLFHFFR
jgi:hypothetical protein